MSAEFFTDISHTVVLGKIEDGTEDRCISGYHVCFMASVAVL